MPALCTVCHHSERARIDLALANRVPFAAVSRKFQLSKDALYRHRRAHLPKPLVAALLKAMKPTDIDLDALRQSESEGLLQSLLVQRARLWQMIDKSETLGDLRAAAQLQARLTDNIQLTAKLVGQLNTASQTTVTNIVVSAEYGQLRAALMQALRPFAEARQAVVRTLQSVESKAVEVKHAADA